MAFLYFNIYVKLSSFVVVLRIGFNHRITVAKRVIIIQQFLLVFLKFLFIKFCRRKFEPEVWIYKIKCFCRRKKTPLLGVFFKSKTFIGAVYALIITGVDTHAHCFLGAFKLLL